MTEPSPRPPRSSRGNPALGDILRSVGVLGLIIVALFGIGQIMTITPDEPVREVDFLTGAAGVEARTGFVPLVPAEAPGRATSARVEPTSWSVGFVVEGDHFIGHVQSRDRLDLVLREVAPESEPTGDVEIDGRPWRIHTEPDGDLTYTSEIESLTVAVSSDLGRDDVVAYIASLEPFVASGPAASDESASD